MSELPAALVATAAATQSIVRSRSYSILRAFTTSPRRVPVILQRDHQRGEKDLEIIRRGMQRHTEQFVPAETYADLTFTMRDDDGQLQGAALGEAGRGWLHVSLIWVHEDYRNLGHGSALLSALESEARANRCQQAYLDTFDYQARPFYEKHGYRVFGELPDYPQGHTRFFMKKALVSAASL